MLTLAVALLTSALTKSTLTVDWSTMSVGSASQWVPLVSLTPDAYRWDPCVRFKKEKEKGKKGCRVQRKNWAGRLGPSLRRLGSQRGLARPAASQAGSGFGSGRRAGSGL